jgi:hypothetical protein
VTDIVIESLSNPHRDIPDDTQIFAQLIIHDIILRRTVAVKKETGRHSWKVEADFEM